MERPFDLSIDILSKLSALKDVLATTSSSQRDSAVQEIVGCGGSCQGSCYGDCSGGCKDSCGGGTTTCCKDVC